MTEPGIGYTEAEERVPEAEVSLGLAFHLLAMAEAGGTAEVASDWAQIGVGRREEVPIAAFLWEMGWQQVEQRGKNEWQCCAT